MTQRPGRGRVILKVIWLVLVLRKDTRSFYDSFGREYDTLVSEQPNGAEAARFLGEYLKERTLPVHDLLDLGCGTGLYSQHLIPFGQRVHGVDYSSGKIDEAHRKSLSLVLTQGDVLSLPYRNATFDVVTSYQTLPHFPNEEAQFFREAYRVLKPGGIFFVDAVSPVRKKSPSGFAKALRRGVYRVTNIQAWLQVPTKEQLAAILKDAGFRAETDKRQYAKEWEFLVGRKR